MHTNTQTNTKARYHSVTIESRRGQDAGRSSPRPPVWRPQPVGLTRAELRRIVLDTLG